MHGLTFTACLQAFLWILPIAVAAALIINLVRYVTLPGELVACVAHVIKPSGDLLPPHAPAICRYRVGLNMTFATLSFLQRTRGRGWKCSSHCRYRGLCALRNGDKAQN